MWYKRGSMAELTESPGPALSTMLADIDAIVRLQDPVVRNLRITQSYHTLSARLAEVIDAGNANWSTFALWASKTAGESIRNEEVPRLVLDLLKEEEAVSAPVEHFIASLLGPARIGIPDVLDAVRETLRDVSRQVADGNLKVYRELAPLFAHYADEVCAAPVADPNLLARFVEKLVPGPAEQGGQALLAESFTQYFRARSTGDPKQRAELVLEGNCRIGLHEQTRLQPNIDAAINAPVADILVTRLTQRFSMVAAAVSVPLKILTARIGVYWAEIATRYVMNLSLPDGNEIALGRDVPPLLREFPPALDELDNVELITLLRRYDHNLRTLRGSAAQDWSKLEDRMRFIVDLFRSRQQDAALFGQPFSDEQRSELMEGRLPAGRL
jgi:hypothetical protein